MSPSKQPKTDDPSYAPTTPSNTELAKTPKASTPTSMIAGESVEELTFAVVSNPGKKQYQQDMPIVVPSMAVVNPDLKDTRQREASNFFASAHYFLFSLSDMPFLLFMMGTVEVFAGRYAHISIAHDPFVLRT
jgi:hypothetical protein